MMASYQVPLNASNYVSPERKKAFQEALEDEHRITGSDAAESAGTGLSNRKDAAPSGPASGPSQPETGPSRASNPAGSSSPLMESLSAGMTKFYDHQNRTLEIHEQYLRQQGQYAELFSQVLQHQDRLLQHAENGSAGPLVESLHRSLENFHLLQDRGLEVHQQFLEQAAANSRAFVNLLEKQHNLLGNGKVPAAAAPPTRPGQVDQTAPEPAAVSPQGEKPPVPSEAESAEPRPSGAAPAVPVEELTRSMLEIVAEKTGYPAEMLELEMDMEADLGIDSIKRVEILGALEDRYPELPQPDTDALAELRTLGEVVEWMGSDAGAGSGPSPSTPTQPDPAPAAESGPAARSQPEPSSSSSPEPASAQDGPGLDELTDLLLKVVADKTGYPAEMLELDMDMEADLGIDSIKRVEILGAMEEQVPDLPPFETDTLAELRTLGEIVEVMDRTDTSPAAAPEPAPAEVKKKAPESSLTVSPVRPRLLPPPDHYAFAVPPDRPLVVTNEGTAFTTQLAGMLSSAGWEVVVWNFPEALVQPASRELNGEHPRLSQSGPELEDLKAAWKELTERYGRPAGLIHLHPQPSDLSDFHSRERALVKQVFFLAGLFDGERKKPEPGERSLFLTVTREDGLLGTAGLRDHFHESTGFPGLIKTLRWEWPDVFCRAVDLDPSLALEELTAAVLAEMHDPDRGLAEVGVNADGRMTLTKDSTA
jgi:acyl carrier protein